MTLYTGRFLCAQVYYSLQSSAQTILGLTFIQKAALKAVKKDDIL